MNSVAMRPALWVLVLTLASGGREKTMAAEPDAIHLDPVRLVSDSPEPKTAVLPAGSGEQETPETQPAAAGWPPGLMMDGLDAIGLGKPMQELGLRTYGYVEAGMTFELSGPGDKHTGLPLRSFDSRRPQNLRLNQLTLFLDRPVDTSKSFDAGGTFTFLYGTDARLTHSLGLLDKQNHEAQPDILQGYGELWFKTGEGGQGLDVIFGKWFTPVGCEVTVPSSNFLYSHGYLFSFAQPVAHTGLKLTYYFDPVNYAYFGVVRGWDVFDDNNDGATFMGGFQLSSKQLMGANPRSQLAVNVIAGPEQTGEGWPGNRVLLDVVWIWRWTEKLTQHINADYGFQDDVPGALGDGDVPGVRDSAWYGLGYWLNYAFNDYLSATGRAEWFTDNHGVRTGYRGTFFEATTGLSITPFPNDRVLRNLIIRPEIRADWSANDAPFAGNCQMTAAFDVIYKF
ncbi:MAG: outer membrane beta-barrel protein [Phycisphaerae bacterium]|nr:outer membrane beta-barrel protein [Phycisphaerae bacterium]